MSENDGLLSIREVSKIFSRGTIDEVIALNRVNLNVYDQDFITVIGSNGAGKSTLLNIVAGVFPPERGGKVIINGDDVEFVDAIGDCVVVLTNLAHLGGYTIEECIDAAWAQISNRKGKMVNGTFVKEEQKQEIHPDSSYGQYIQRNDADKKDFNEAFSAAFSAYLKSKTNTL